MKRKVFAGLVAVLALTGVVGTAASTANAGGATGCCRDIR